MMDDKKDKKEKEIIKEPTGIATSEPPKPPSEIEMLGLVESEMLEPINLTKLETKLYTAKVTEHLAMGNQINNVLNTLANENRRALQESFAENHDIDLMEKKYEFDVETMTFIDYRIIRERARRQMGNPRLMPVTKR